jgi:hypothetical protein
VRVSGATLQGEVTSVAPTMTSSFDPSLRYCWRIAAIGGWGGGFSHKKATSWPSSNPMKISWSSRLYTRCVEREHPDVRRAAVSFSRYTIQVENFAKRD